MLLPKLLVVFPGLGGELLWPSDRRQWTPSAFELFQLSRSALAARIDTVDFDSVRAAGDM